MTFAVVLWYRRGSTALQVEEIEVLNIQKIIIEGSAAPDSECKMQYQQEMWCGKIRSLHGKSPFPIILLMIVLGEQVTLQSQNIGL